VIDFKSLIFYSDCKYAFGLFAGLPNKSCAILRFEPDASDASDASDAHISFFALTENS
jgi:hypothetical protein